LSVTKTTRLSALLNALGINQVEFAQKIGLSKAVVSHYFTGRRDLTEKAIQKIIKEYPNVNGDFLRGESEKILLDTYDKEYRPLEVNEDQVKYLKEALQKMESVAHEERQNKKTAERTNSTGSALRARGKVCGTHVFESSPAVGLHARRGSRALCGSR